MKILVVTNCTKTKNPRPEENKAVLEQHGLDIPRCDLEREQEYRRILSTKPARELFGGSFTFVKDLVNHLRRLKNDVDFYVISGRYGLINENDEVIPYDCALSEMTDAEVRARSAKLRIFENIVDILTKGYDEVIVALSRKYLLTIFDPVTGKDFTEHLKGSKLTIFAAKSLQSLFKYEQMNFIGVVGIGDRNSKIAAFAASRT